MLNASYAGNAWQASSDVCTGSLRRLAATSLQVQVQPLERTCCRYGCSVLATHVGALP